LHEYGSAFGAQRPYTPIAVQNAELGQSFCVRQADTQRNGFVVAPKLSQFPLRHSLPAVPFRLVEQHAPSGLVPCWYMLAGTHAVDGLGGSQKEFTIAPSHVQTKPGRSPSQSDCEPSHSSSHMSFPPPSATQLRFRHSAFDVQQ
jgi:hypothetical protein